MPWRQRIQLSFIAMEGLVILYCKAITFKKLTPWLKKGLAWFACITQRSQHSKKAKKNSWIGSAAHSRLIVGQPTLERRVQNATPTPSRARREAFHDSGRMVFSHSLPRR